MSTQIITAIDICSDIDPTRPVASCKRVGGGQWAVVLLGENDASLDRELFPDVDSAVTFARGIADLVDADTKNPAYVTAVTSQLARRDAQIREKDATISAQDRQIAALQKQIVEAVPADVVPVKGG